jgi:transcriptional regulator of acetoin/glycerol metabolism
MSDARLASASSTARYSVSIASVWRPRPRLARALLDYSWPLNVRELENCLTVASTLADGGTIHRKHLPEDIVEPSGVPEDDAADRKTELIALLREHHGNISAISKATGKSRMQLHRWLKRYELDPNVYRNK